MCCKPEVYNRRRSGAPEDAVDISRTGPFGNPFPIEPGRTRTQSVAEHRKYLFNDAELRALVQKELRGKDLLCWCKPRACHGDNILEIANMDELI